MIKKKENRFIIIAGIIIGIVASLLVYFGNPKNMGFCIACFIRDIAGGLGLHRAAPVQYIRPEIIGIILSALILSVIRKEFAPHGGSSPITRFVLGLFVMIGGLMFLGCPFRMIVRLAGGDLNAIVGLIGFVCGIAVGIFFLNKGYTLGRTYKQRPLEGAVFPFLQIVLLLLLVVAPAFIFFTEAGGGPGAKHAAIAISLAAGLIVGGLAQRSRLCMIGGFRDLILFRKTRLIAGFIAILCSALIVNLALTALTGETYFSIGFSGQPVAHTDGLWNASGMFLVGFASVLLGGCPLRQLVLAGEGNIDSAITILGLVIGAAFAHNFGLASSGEGPTANGKIAVVIGIIVCALIASLNTFRKAEN